MGRTQNACMESKKRATATPSPNQLQIAPTCPTACCCKLELGAVTRPVIVQTSKEPPALALDARLSSSISYQLACGGPCPRR